MQTLIKKIKRNGFKVSLKKLVLIFYQKVRIYFYKITSLNKPDLKECQLNQPICFRGEGKIFAINAYFGVSSSPYFLNGYSYIEARASTARVEIHQNTFINNNAVIIADRSSIYIGSCCLIGWNFSVYDSDFHGLNSKNRMNGNYKTSAVVICDNVFIGNNVIITKGVTIGENAVIGAGSVVTRNVPPNTIYAGCPAKFISNIPSTEGIV